MKVELKHLEFDELRSLTEENKGQVVFRIKSKYLTGRFAGHFHDAITKFNPALKVFSPQIIGSTLQYDLTNDHGTAEAFDQIVGRVIGIMESEQDTQFVHAHLKAFQRKESIQEFKESQGL